ncbi:MAG: glycosyltransferase family 4 protein [Planctomycetes bacterium]|nr:glycosyltransferase family 4 protein [Planctomycetota bacterium]
MRFAFDFTSAVKREPTGIARYVSEILRAMLKKLHADDEIVLGFRLSRWNRREFAPKFDDPRVCTRPLQSPFAFLTYGKPDIFHGLGVNVPRGLPSSTRKFVTIHGFIGEDEVAPEKREAYKRRLAKIQTMISRADRAFVVSNYERERTAELCGCPVDKLKAIYHGVDHDRYHQNGDPARDRAAVEAKWRESAGGAPRPFFLCLGAITNRKNVPLLLEAFERCRARKEFDLVLAGQSRSETPAILDRMRSLKLEKHVHIIGHLASNAIPAWLRSARALVHPSRYESFGLPLIEAMACGAPVLCSDTSAMPEITGGASLLFSPSGPDAVAAAIDRAAYDDVLCVNLRKLGIARAAEFTWERAADETLSSYRAALEAVGKTLKLSGKG